MGLDPTNTKKGMALIQMKIKNRKLTFFILTIVLAMIWSITPVAAADKPYILDIFDKARKMAFLTEVH